MDGRHALLGPIFVSRVIGQGPLVFMRMLVCHLIEMWPHGSRRGNVANVRRDRCKVSVEVLHRLDYQDLLLRHIDTEACEGFRTKSL